MALIAEGRKITSWCKDFSKLWTVMSLSPEKNCIHRFRIAGFASALPSLLAAS